MGDGIDQLPPHSVEAEEAILGAIMLDPSAFYAVSYLKASDFFIVRNEWVFEAITALHNRGEEIDNVTVVDELRFQGRLNEIGGPSYITYLLNHTPSSIYTESYGQIVYRGAIRRRGLVAASEIAQAMHAETGSIEDTIKMATDAFFKFLSFQSFGHSASASEIVSEVMIEAEAAYTAYMSGNMIGLPSSFSALDDLIGGFHKRRFYVLAGRPGMGKTSFILTLLYTLAKAGVPVGLFSLEMDRTEVVRRLASMETKLSTHAIENGRLTPKEFGLFTEATTRLSPLPFWVNDIPANNIAALRTQAREWFLEHGVRAVFVDYLQLARGDQNRENRTLEVGSISRGLKQCARELEIPVIAAAQLNRAVENRAEKRPTLSDIRESGEIENDADVVMFLYRDEYYNPNTEDQNIGEINIAKHRNGPTGMVQLLWKPEQTMFKDIADKDVLDLRGYSPAYAENAL